VGDAAERDPPVLRTPDSSVYRRAREDHRVRPTAFALGAGDDRGAPHRSPVAPTRLARVLTTIDLAVPLLDAAYVFLWIPGIMLACFGFFWIVGPMTLAVVPLTLAVYTILFHYQRRRVFEPLGREVRHNLVGLFLFVVIYQLFMSIFSVVGYAQELTWRTRRWK